MSTDKIYRYINFFDLYNMVERKLLRISQATGFDDKNEGFAFLLRALEGKYVAALGGRSEFNGLEIVKTLSYISCWTAEPNKIAMWLLYSRNSDGLRIQTTRAKLNSVLTNYRKSYSSSEDKIHSFSPRDDASIFTVTYENFRAMKNEIEARNNEIQKTIDGLPQNTSTANRLRAFSKAARETMKTLRYMNNPWSYKDIAYNHEEEVRAFIEFEPSDEEGDFLASGGFGDNLSYLSDMFPPYIEIALCDDFIEDICIDERCAEFKKKVCRYFLSKYRYSLRESYVFSSLVDEPRIP